MRTPRPAAVRRCRREAEGIEGARACAEVAESFSVSSPRKEGEHMVHGGQA